MQRSLLYRLLKLEGSPMQFMLETNAGLRGGGEFTDKSCPTCTLKKLRCHPSHEMLCLYIDTYHIFIILKFYQIYWKLILNVYIKYRDRLNNYYNKMETDKILYTLLQYLMIRQTIFSPLKIVSLILWKSSLLLNLKIPWIFQFKLSHIQK